MTLEQNSGAPLYTTKVVSGAVGSVGAEVVVTASAVVVGAAVVVVDDVEGGSVVGNVAVGTVDGFVEAPDAVEPDEPEPLGPPDAPEPPDADVSVLVWASSAPLEHAPVPTASATHKPAANTWMRLVISSPPLVRAPRTSPRSIIVHRLPGTPRNQDQPPVADSSRSAGFTGTPRFGHNATSSRWGHPYR